MGLDIPLVDLDYPELVERSKVSADTLSMGKRAYAHRQAALRRDLAARAKSNHTPLYDKLAMFGQGNDVRDARIMVECIR